MNTDMTTGGLNVLCNLLMQMQICLILLTLHCSPILYRYIVTLLMPLTPKMSYIMTAVT